MKLKGLRRLYFISLGGSSYGNLIQKRNKAEFLGRVERFEAVLAVYAKLVRDNLESKMQETRDSLVRSLLPRVVADPPKEWKISSLTGTLAPEEIRRRLEREIDQAFGKVDQTFEPKVVCLFKGVQYETITADPEFRAGLAQHFGEDGAAQLLFEYDASRAEAPTPA